MLTAVAIGLSAFSALCALVTGTFASLRQHRAAREANSIDRFEAFVRALEGRVSDLERELGIVKRALVTEQAAHRRTQDALRLALRYIRELVGWARGAQDAPMPQPPPELEAEL